jgi:hypothetical protein
MRVSMELSKIVGLVAVVLVFLLAAGYAADEQAEPAHTSAATH